MWREPEEEFAMQYVAPTVKHGGGSVLLWGCMASTGVGGLEFIYGIMNGESYKDILDKHLQSSGQKLI